MADSAAGAVQAGRAIFGYGTELGVALLGVGYIVGLNIAVLVFAGGLISWLFGIPIYAALASPGELEAITGDATGYEAALAVWSGRIRYLGVGAMALGGVWALLSLVKPIRDGIRSSLRAVQEARSGNRSDVPRTERDTPINIVLWGTLVMSIPIFISFLFIVDQEALGITAGLYWGTLAGGLVFALLAGFLFASVAGYMAGLVGIVEQSHFRRDHRNDPEHIIAAALGSGIANQFRCRCDASHHGGGHGHSGRSRRMLRGSHRRG